MAALANCKTPSGQPGGPRDSLSVLISLNLALVYIRKDNPAACEVDSTNICSNIAVGCKVFGTFCQLIIRVNGYFHLRFASYILVSFRMLTAFSPEMLVYIDCMSELANISVPASPIFWIV
ncbi:unnamed protein product [Protopolystoma xenopodis]|uniref:Uncharacterized protein n=1 Tax=Protopolystoma xenopodis TaxID=117903 RepID=A0A448WEG0_9PLAT|nr:unnamed protein product [Protopolystoma xenopodis]